MSRPEATWSHYSESYKGPLGEDAFRAALPDASARVRERTAHVQADSLSEADTLAYLDAVCAACDRISDPALSSWTAGKVSQTFADASSNTVDAAIDRHLAGTVWGCAWL